MVWKRLTSKRICIVESWLVRVTSRMMRKMKMTKLHTSQRFSCDGYWKGVAIVVTSPPSLTVSVHSIPPDCEQKRQESKKTSGTVGQTHLLKVDMSSNKNTVRYFAKCQKSQCNPLFGNSIVWFISKKQAALLLARIIVEMVSDCLIGTSWAIARLISEDLSQGKLLKFEAGSPKHGDQERIQKGVTLWLFCEFDTPKKSKNSSQCMCKFFYFVFSAFVSQEWWQFMQWCGKVQLDHAKRECVQRCMKQPAIWRAESTSIESRCQGWLVSLTLRRVGFGDKSGSLSCCQVNWFVGLWMHDHESRHFIFCAKICFQDSTQQDGLHKVKQCLTYSKPSQNHCF